MDNDYGLLSEDEVMYVRSGRILMSNPTFKVSEFLDALAQLVSEQEREWSDEREGWFNERGQGCEVLRFDGQGWQRGRVRLRLEFCPEPAPKLLNESRSVQDSGYDGEQFERDEFSRDEFSREEYGRDEYGRGEYGQDASKDYGREIPSPRRSREPLTPLSDLLPRNPNLSEPDDY